MFTRLFNKTCTNCGKRIYEVVGYGWRHVDTERAKCVGPWGIDVFLFAVPNKE